MSKPKARLRLYVSGTAKAMLDRTAHVEPGSQMFRSKWESYAFIDFSPQEAIYRKALPAGISPGNIHARYCLCA